MGLRCSSPSILQNPFPFNYIAIPEAVKILSRKLKITSSLFLEENPFLLLSLRRSWYLQWQQWMDLVRFRNKSHLAFTSNDQQTYFALTYRPLQILRVRILRKNFNVHNSCLFSFRRINAFLIHPPRASESGDDDKYLGADVSQLWWIAYEYWK